MTDRAANSLASRRGRILALIAALLGWMFDGFEMGLFPVIARPALSDVLSRHSASTLTPLDDLVGLWNGIAIAAFLIGAAAGGVLFGWLGDRIGRAKAMSLSILTYALVSGAGAFAESAWQLVLIRFVAALGMGGEWSLGVALVMEVWEGRSRAFLAATIGAAANAGFALVALLSLGLNGVRESLSAWGLSSSWVEWRMLMLCGVLPACLTFFIRQFVPESSTWQRAKDSGETSGWATRDLWSVALGVLACWGIIVLWTQPRSPWLQLSGTVLALVVVAGAFLYPVFRYVARTSHGDQQARQVMGHMLLGALLSGIPLLGTWASVQWAPMWADELSHKLPTAKALTQFCSASGAIIGGVAGALLGGWLGRRAAYFSLCGLSLGSVWLFYWSNEGFQSWFLITVSLMGGVTAAFYGWLPLYLPELFPTRVRATGQGFSYNFGRILAAIGALQTGAIMGSFQGGYPQACSTMGAVYLIGLAVIWLAPETRQRRLPD
jgi:MFS family permease